MDKLKLHTPNLTQDNISRIRELFPNCVTEAAGKDGKVTLAVDFDLLRQELSESIVEGPQERYRLDWPGKREALLAANAPIAKTLRPCRDESVDFESTKNLYIEGDNLDALKLLQETYLGKVKMIYIDPPYNTGNDFIYADDFSESADEFLLRSNQKDEEGNRLVANTESNGRFHSDWLSMMYPRLKLARNLLRDDGVIFISCDDREVGNLRKLSDQIFGEINFIPNVIWQKKYTRSNDAKYFSDNHDHILCYGKEKTKVTFNLIPRNEEQLSAYSNPDNHPKGVWKATPLHAKSGTNSSEYIFKNGVKWNPPVGTYRRYNDESMHIMDVNNEIWFGTDGNQIPSKKSFLSEVKDGVTAVTLWLYEEVGHNHEANNELKKIELGGFFSNPKPTRLIKQSLILTTKPNDIILDFFSGSATTAHAVMQLNAEDGGNRQFIMVQLPEVCDEKSEAYKAGYKTIAEIGKERIRRAGAKIKAELEQKTSQNGQGSLFENTSTRDPATLDIGFRVLKVDSSNMADVYYTPDTLNQQQLSLLTDNIKSGRTSEDLLFQVLLDWGVDLTLPIRKESILGKTVFFVDENALVACFDTNITEELVKELTKVQPLRVVFRDNGDEDQRHPDFPAAVSGDRGQIHMTEQNAKNVLIRNATTEFLIFTAQAGEQSIEAHYEDESIWLSQKLMATLFDVDVRTISEHLKNIFESQELQQDGTIRKFRIVQQEGSRQVNREVDFYNLDAIISVGYRVNSIRATQFRQWATQVLREFAIKGYVLDRKRLENGTYLGEDYFEHLLEEIQEIRLSERKFYQKITDIYATSLDYNPHAPTSKTFFAEVQNKLHFAVHGHTAAELILARADSEKEHMGLTSWKNAPHGKVLKGDVSTAKNYLSKEELESLGRIVSAWLDLAEDRAKRQVPMTMQDWAKRLDMFLEFADRAVLSDSGKRTMKQAKKYAENEFEKFRPLQDSTFESDFDKFVQQLPQKTQ